MIWQVTGLYGTGPAIPRVIFEGTSYPLVVRWVRNSRAFHATNYADPEQAFIDDMCRAYHHAYGTSRTG